MDPMLQQFGGVLYHFMMNPLAMLWLGFFLGVLVTLKIRKEV